MDKRIYVICGAHGVGKSLLREALAERDDVEVTMSMPKDRVSGHGGNQIHWCIEDDLYVLEDRMMVLHAVGTTTGRRSSLPARLLPDVYEEHPKGRQYPENSTFRPKLHRKSKPW